MKKLWLISAIVIPLVLFGFFLSCDTAGGGNEDGLSGYYIYALLDGTVYEWRLGLTLIEDDAFATRNTEFTNFTMLFATPDVEPGIDEPNNYVEIAFEGTTGTYSISDIAFAGYIINGVEWEFTDITVVVSTYEDVGGVIKGTFSGTVQEEGNINTMTVKNGQFNVIRAPDDSPPR